MRNLIPSSLADIPTSESPRTSKSPKVHLHSALSFNEQKPGSFSQLNRQCRMRENSTHIRMFMDEQQRVIKDLIKQFQIFVGYREQISDADLTKTSETWYVYLMHVQSLQNAMKSTHKGKRLFGNGSEPPIRVHLDDGNQVSSFDLPDPSLSSMISIRSFLGGVLDHKLPSIELGNACLADLLNALVENQGGRIRLSRIQERLLAEKSSARRHLPVHIAKVSKSLPQSSALTWYDKIRKISRSFWSPFSPGNVMG